MPRFDGTGPFGTGPFGRGMGPCGGGLARGRGRGFFRGFGWGMAANPMPPVDQKEWLNQQKNWLENQLKSIAEQLQELDKK